jgi:hypothetical protein
MTLSMPDSEDGVDLEIEDAQGAVWLSDLATESLETLPSRSASPLPRPRLAAMATPSPRATPWLRKPSRRSDGTADVDLSTPDPTTRIREEFSEEVQASRRRGFRGSFSVRWGVDPASSTCYGPWIPLKLVPSESAEGPFGKRFHKTQHRRSEPDSELQQSVPQESEPDDSTCAKCEGYLNLFSKCAHIMSDSQLAQIHGGSST